MFWDEQKISGGPVKRAQQVPADNGQEADDADMKEAKEEVKFASAFIKCRAVWVYSQMFLMVCVCVQVCAYARASVCVRTLDYTQTYLAIPQGILWGSKIQRMNCSYPRRPCQKAIRNRLLIPSAPRARGFVRVRD